MDKWDSIPKNLIKKYTMNYNVPIFQRQNLKKEDD